MRAKFVGVLGQTFSSLRVRNFRLFFFGQSVSRAGTWMQMTAQAWLVLTLTHSGTDLGLVVALQTLPVLVLAPYGGVVADRIDKRRLLAVLQVLMGMQALVLGVLSALDMVSFAEVCALAVVLGLNNAFETPARQAFVREMVGLDELRNAVTLNSVTQNAARAVGPAVAGLLIATVGLSACFLLNAASFGAVVVSLVLMNPALLSPSQPLAREKGQLREGIAYSLRTPKIAVPLAMMLIVGTLTYEFQVTLPVLARSTFHGGSAAYGFMTGAMGAGAVVGGLVAASRSRTGLRVLLGSLMAFGLAVGALALAPSLAIAYVLLAVVGWASVAFTSLASSTIQLSAAPQMRGRSVALWQVAMQGTTPLGGPFIGWVVDVADPRVALGVGAAGCLVAAALGVQLAKHFRHQTAPEPLPTPWTAATVAEPAVSEVVG